MKTLGIYIHIPFCISKCAYCDFYSLADCNRTEEYIEALKTQIKSFKKRAAGYTVDTIYFGGGTPSCIQPEYISDLLSTVRKTFKVHPKAEITLEANPGTLDSNKLSIYRSAGVNRLSIGLQSANNAELKMLSRIHTWEEFESTFVLARFEGFDNINVDIMYALPQQSRTHLAETVNAVMNLSPDHISFYGLKIEQNTPFGNNPEIAKRLPDEESQYKMYMESAKRFEDGGYMQYEISNFAKKGKKCRHNIKYWRCENYLGFGVAAASLFEGELFSYAKNIDAFIDDPKSPALVESTQKLSEKDLATQYIMLGMRLTSGVDRTEYFRRFGRDLDADYYKKLKPFIEKRLAEKTVGGYRLTRRGMLVSNYILSDILEF
ncbi:MAG: radical SAM family heme chaperone HemW [Clostridia bacterium]|nr:radical SAM family heme chaperone HemW [Clostridia bacterium]